MWRTASSTRQRRIRFHALAEAFCDEAERQQRVAMPLRIYFADSESVEAAQRWALNEPELTTKKSTRSLPGKKTVWRKTDASRRLSFPRSAARLDG